MKHKPFEHMKEITCFTDKSKWYWCDEYRAEIDRLTTQLEKATKTLVQSGYEDAGGELWKPPIQNKGVFESLTARLDASQALLAEMKDEAFKREARIMMYVKQLADRDAEIARLKDEIRHTDNEKLARWQGWSRTNGGNWINPFTKMACFEHPDYLNDDAAAMSLLDTLVEKGCGWDLRTCINPIESLVSYQFILTQPSMYYPNENSICSEANTRCEAVVAACLDLIEKEAESGKQ